ncbi:MAG: nitrous oxide reductase family maturation protein NosD [Bacteroidetes bacterium]|nr:nitrous oxide reductase family maturation protein NosD [Bacteroidota bacterium]
MSKVVFYFGVIFLLNSSVQGAVLLVGKNQTITSLNKAIQLAKEGDTIRILPGVYKEKNLVINKRLTLLGEGSPLFDGENKYEILLINANKVEVSGLSFDRSGYSAMNDFAAIKVIDTDSVTISNVQIFNAYFAIHVSNSTRTQIHDNDIIGSPASEQMTGNGIHLWKCSQAHIYNNNIRGHRDGIYFEFVTDSKIEKNFSRKNIRYGLHFMFSNSDYYGHNKFIDNGAGVAVMYSKNVTMLNNWFQQNWGASSYGLLLKDITDSHIEKNKFIRNTVGVLMEGSSRLQVKQNLFQANGWAMKVQASCDDNLFEKNNFIGNSFDIGTNGTLVLNKFTQNYWDKYEGYDLDRDGRGDIPHHPATLYSMLIEQNPTTLLLFRSFIVTLLDKAERAIPSLTPELLRDERPVMKQLLL